MTQTGSAIASTPNHNDRSACKPVRVDYAATEYSHLHSHLRGLFAARNNLLSIWSANAYQMQTFQFQIFRQHYFVCNAPDAVRRVFLEEHDNYDRKSPQMRHALEPLLGDGLFVSDGDLWRERRAHCAPAFENDLLPGFAEIMTQSARELAEQWQKSDDGRQVDMLNEMARLTARIIGRSVFGDDTSSDEAAQVVKGFAKYQQAVEQLDFADSFGFPILRGLGNPFRRRRVQRAAADVHEVIDRIVARHKRKTVTDRFSLLSLLLNSEVGKGDGAKGCPLSETGARNEAIVMFMAGHETTANALAWTWYLLDCCPDATGKLHQELDLVLGDRPPTLDDVAKLPYTRAVFEEAMRLYPPVPLLSRQARDNDLIRKKSIKPGSIILVIPWLLHRHELYWEQPNSFIPERFLPGKPRPDKFIYMPFSVGRRVCLGQRFGLTEGILCLATLAQRFRPRLIPNHKVEIECRLTLRPKGGLPMFIESRKS